MIWALSPEKKRSVQRVDASVYLMNHIACRAILVECGFLSNPEEDRLLQEPAYQRKLAMVLASSYLTSGSAQEGRILCMKAKTIFYCTQCGNEFPQVAGAVPRLWCLEHHCGTARPSQREGHRQTRPCTRRHPCAETGLRNDF